MVRDLLFLFLFFALIQGQCTQQSYGNANWPTTAVNVVAKGTCIPGFTGSPTRRCNAGNVWATNIISGHCTRLACPGRTEANATWAATASGNVRVGQCLPGFGGRVTRTCTLQGTWTAVNGTCAKCNAEFYARSNWTTTPAMGWAYSTCELGYYGSPRRWCEMGGVWQTYIWDVCTRANCSAANLDNAQWPVTNTFVWAHGTCNPGYVGNPSRQCLGTRVFGPVTNGCLPISKCKSEFYGRTTWPETTSGNVAVGVCQDGFEGSPTRRCKFDGTWETNINLPCTRKVCKGVQVGNVIFGDTVAGSTGAGSCAAGTSPTNGTPSRLCTLSGTWAPTFSGSCA